MTVTLTALAFGACLTATPPPDEPSPPNVLLILADDLGIGDPRCYNDESRVPMPNLDRFASEGMSFADAHTPSSVCTPTRYGLLTGRYGWRSRLTQGVLSGYSPALIEEDRQTIASMLKMHGYQTAGIGKWHLGDQRAFLPLQHGFDSFLGLLYIDEMDNS